MHISCGSMLKSKHALVVVIVILCCSCSPKFEQGPSDHPVTKVEKPFAAAGTIEMQLGSGEYDIRAGNDERIRVSFSGNPGDTSAELATHGTRANLEIRDTPRNNFRATVEVPATSDLKIRLTAGNLRIAEIAGNKDVESKAGNVGIKIPNASDYGTVVASVTVGDLNAGPFGGNESGLSPGLKWSGPGKYTLRASLGAGNLEFTH